MQIYEPLVLRAMKVNFETLTKMHISLLHIHVLITNLLAHTLAFIFFFHYLSLNVIKISSHTLYDLMI